MNVAFFSTISAIAQGSSDGPDDPSAYTNLYPNPVYVTDIVFDWDFTIPTRTSQTYGIAMGDTIRAKLLYRNNPITNGLVPVNLLARTQNWRANTPPMIKKTQVVHSTYTWRLPQPLWLPPNVPLTVQIGHFNDFTVDVADPAQDVDVTIRGYLDESNALPDYIDIPYATAFLGPVRSSVVAATTGLAPIVTERTAQTDLFNPFNVPLNVERLCYEIGVSGHGIDFGGATSANFAPTDATSAQDQTSNLLAGQNYGLDRRYVNIKLTSSKGRALIKDYIPIGSVISSNNRSLDLKCVLDPQAYYIASIQEQMPLFTDRATLPFQMRTGLSLVGSRRLTREEALGTYWR